MRLPEFFGKLLVRYPWLHVIVKRHVINPFQKEKPDDTLLVIAKPIKQRFSKETFYMCWSKYDFLPWRWRLYFSVKEGYGIEPKTHEYVLTNYFLELALHKGNITLPGKLVTTQRLAV